MEHCFREICEESGVWQFVEMFLNNLDEHWENTMNLVSII